MISARLYKHLGGDAWAGNIVLAACLFPVEKF